MLSALCNLAVAILAVSSLSLFVLFLEVPLFKLEKQIRAQEKSKLWQKFDKPRLFFAKGKL